MSDFYVEGEKNLKNGEPPLAYKERPCSVLEKHVGKQHVEMHRVSKTLAELVLALSVESESTSTVPDSTVWEARLPEESQFLFRINCYAIFTSQEV